jgi:hypothetical protein
MKIPIADNIVLPLDYPSMLGFVFSYPASIGSRTHRGLTVLAGAVARTTACAGGCGHDPRGESA